MFRGATLFCFREVNPPGEGKSFARTVPLRWGEHPRRTAPRGEEDVIAVTISDVAAHAGVSPATVSRVLSGSRPVRPEVATRVRLAAAELGYTVDGIARALRTRRTDTVGMVVPSILNPFFTTLVDSMENALHAEGKQLFLCDSRHDPAVEAEHLRSLIDRHVDGIVVSPVHDTESVPAVARSAAAVPLVQLDRRVDVAGTDWIGLDDTAAMRLVLTHLAATGARSIAFATSELTNSSTSLRLQGFERWTRELGLRVVADGVVLGDFSVDSGDRAGRRLLRSEDRPDAIVCADDLIAIGVLRAAREAGVAVPHDLQVTGFDDIVFASYVTPALTTLAQPTDRMAAEALRLLSLRSRATDPAGGARISFAPALVARQSTR